MGRRQTFPWLVALTVTGCGVGDGSSGTPSIPADRPILGWDGAAALNQNAGVVPASFTAPDPRACATDTSRVYIGELFTHGLTDIQVAYHWAPILPGAPPAPPTVGQPELSLAGVLDTALDSTDDVLADHPFGLDVVSDVGLDPELAYLATDVTGAVSGSLHTEVETRILPRADLAWTPAAGDRTLMRGVWVLDCGHTPYGTEMHPPSFLAYARASDAQTTEAAVVFVPYRSSLLFTRDASLADQFTNTARFSDPSTKPFSQALVDAILHAAVSNDDRLALHALMLANRFDEMQWLVCAPNPRPPGAALDASWRLTARAGVTVTATPDDPSGCVRFDAKMSASYVPLPLAHVDADWPWDQLSASASEQAGQTVDVRQTIIDILAARGLNGASVPALQPDHPPLVDAYPALATRAGADADAPTAIDGGADDQPFPFYGRVRVGWR